MSENEKQPQELHKKKRKLYFRILLKLMKCRYKEPKFVYLGEEITTGGLILSNHEGTDAPMSLEMYLDRPLRMWGAWEMNSGLRKMYSYQTRVYYHEKKHWNLHLARLFCLLASPLTNIFYSGFDLISTYRDSRFLKTIRESIDALKAGDNIVIFPEDSSEGYKPELDGFFQGFVALAEVAYKKGMDLPIFVTYFQKEKKVYVIDKPVKYSELIKDGATREEIATRLVNRCNELGKMDFSSPETSTQTEEIEIKEEIAVAEEKTEE